MKFLQFDLIFIKTSLKSAKKINSKNLNEVIKSKIN